MTLSEPLGFGLIVALVTYVSIVVGELAPKRLALRHAEALACAVAPAMTIISRIAAPAGWLLDASTDLVFRLLGRAEAPEERVTEDDVRARRRSRADRGDRGRRAAHDRGRPQAWQPTGARGNDAPRRGRLAGC